MSYTYINGGFKKIEGQKVLRRSGIKNENITYVNLPETLITYLKMIGVSRHFIAIVDEFGDDDIKFTQYECIAEHDYEEIMKYAQLSNTDVKNETDADINIKKLLFEAQLYSKFGEIILDNMFIMICDDADRNEIIYLTPYVHNAELYNLAGMSISFYKPITDTPGFHYVGSVHSNTFYDLFKVNDVECHDYAMKNFNLLKKNNHN